MIEVLIPVHNGERFLAETLASIRGADPAVRESLKRKPAHG